MFLFVFTDLFMKGRKVLGDEHYIQPPLPYSHYQFY